MKTAPFSIWRHDVGRVIISLGTTYGLGFLMGFWGWLPIFCYEFGWTVRGIAGPRRITHDDFLAQVLSSAGLILNFWRYGYIWAGIMSLLAFICLVLWLWRYRTPRIENGKLIEDDLSTLWKF